MLAHGTKILGLIDRHLQNNQLPVLTAPAIYLSEHEWQASPLYLSKPKTDHCLHLRVGLKNAPKGLGEEIFISPDQLFVLADKTIQKAQDLTVGTELFRPHPGELERTLCKNDFDMHLPDWAYGPLVVRWAIKDPMPRELYTITGVPNCLIGNLRALIKL